MSSLKRPKKKSNKKYKKLKMALEHQEICPCTPSRKLILKSKGDRTVRITTYQGIRNRAVKVIAAII